MFTQYPHDTHAYVRTPDADGLDGVLVGLWDGAAEEGEGVLIWEERVGLVPVLVFPVLGFECVCLERLGTYERYP